MPNSEIKFFIQRDIDMLFATIDGKRIWDVFFLFDKNTFYINYSIESKYENQEDFLLKKSLGFIFQKIKVKEINSIVLKKNEKRIQFLINAGFQIKKEQPDSVILNLKRT